MRADKKKFSTRLMAALMAGTLAAGMMGMSVFAAESSGNSTTTTTAKNKVTITKTLTKRANTYVPINSTFEYTIEPGESGTLTQDDGSEIPITAGDLNTISKKDSQFSFDPNIEGDLSKTSLTQNATIEFDASKFSGPGIYSYKIKETIPGDADKIDGMTYDNTEKILYVYVEVQNGTRVIGGYTFAEDKKSERKTEGFTNDYGANNGKVKDLTVEKKIEGNQADPNKKFKFKVTINVADGNEKKYYMDDGTTATATDGTAEISLELKGGEKRTIYGLSTKDTYTVVEEDANTDGYKTTYTDNNGNYNASTKMNDQSHNVVVTNTRNVPSPTGIILNYGPYILMIALAGSMAAFFFFKRNRKEA